MPINADALAVLAGQLAGAIAPGSIGAGLGAAGVEANRGNILAANAEQKKQQMQQMLQSLTGEGMNTTGVTIGPNGELKVTGTAQPQQLESVAGTTQETAQPNATAASAPTAAPATGGGNQTTSPFFSLLGI